jgi:hypothetical protein
MARHGPLFSGRSLCHVFHPDNGWVNLKGVDEEQSGDAIRRGDA